MSLVPGHGPVRSVHRVRGSRVSAKDARVRVGGCEDGLGAGLALVPGQGPVRGSAT